MNNIKISFLSIYHGNMMKQYEDISVCYLASVLRQEGYLVQIIYCDEDEFSLQDIIEFNPQYIGMPIYEETESLVFKLTKLFCQEIPLAKIFVGGYHVTFFSESILNRCPEILCAIRNEGEETVKQLIHALNHEKSLEMVDGITYRNENNEIICNKDRDYINDLDSFPFPARDILVDNKLRIALIQTSRGCSGDCHFCCTKQVWSDWRGRKDYKKIVDEIEYVVKVSGIRYFDFIDCSFEDPAESEYERLKSLTQEMIDRKVNISYFCAFRGDFVEGITDNLILHLKRSGMCGAAPGIETANEFDIKLYGKRATVKQNERIIQTMQKNDIALVPGFINFNPYSSVEGLLENINFLEKHKFACHISFITNSLYLYPHTQIYKRIKSDGLLKTEEYDSQSNYYFVNSNIESLYNYVRTFYQQMNQKSSLSLDMINYFTAVYQLHISHYRRQIECNQDKKAYEYWQTHVNAIQPILEVLNYKFADWFRSLLRLSEDVWSEQKAHEISNAIFSSNELFDYVQQLKIQKSSFSRNLLRCNPLYGSILV